jgi:hypothetical protein
MAISDALIVLNLMGGATCLALGGLQEDWVLIATGFFLLGLAWYRLMPWCR